MNKKIICKVKSDDDPHKIIKVVYLHDVNSLEFEGYFLGKSPHICFLFPWKDVVEKYMAEVRGG